MGSTGSLSGSSPAADSCRSAFLAEAQEDECVLCMQTESELHTPLFLVFQNCGHKCLCKPCSRKLKKLYKSNTPECPLCREPSKLVHVSRYTGKVFGASSG